MTARQIRREVAAKHQVNADMMTMPCNEFRMVDARNEAMARCRVELQLSYAQIGRIFGKHHTSVMHGIRRHEKAIPRPRKEPLQREDISELKAEIFRQAGIIGDQARAIASLSAQIERFMGKQLSGQADLFTLPLPAATERYVAA